MKESKEKESVVYLEPEYLAQIETEKETAALIKKILFLFEKETIIEAVKESCEDTEGNDPMYFVMGLVNDYYKQSIFYHDIEGINKVEELMDLEIKPKFECFRRWFISLGDLHQEFERIQQYGIEIDKQMSHHAIQLYLKTKFTHELLMHYSSVIADKVQMTQVGYDITKLKMKLRYAKSEKPVKFKTPYDLGLFELTKTFEKTEVIPELGVKYDVKQLKRIMGGKVDEVYLRIIVDHFMAYDKNKMNKIQFYSSIFGLFRLIVQDKTLLDGDAFLVSEYRKHKSYEHYSAKMITQLINPRRQ